MSVGINFSKRKGLIKELIFAVEKKQTSEVAPRGLLKARELKTSLQTACGIDETDGA